MVPYCMFLIYILIISPFVVIHESEAAEAPPGPEIINDVIIEKVYICPE
jgi:hypothetical protein